MEKVSEEAVDSAVGDWLEGMGGGEEERGGGAGGSVKRVSEFNGAKSGCGVGGVGGIVSLIDGEGTKNGAILVGFGTWWLDNCHVAQRCEVLQQ